MPLRGARFPSGRLHNIREVDFQFFEDQGADPEQDDLEELDVEDVFERRLREDKAECQFKIAQIYYKDLKNFPRAKQYVRKSLDLNSNSGKAYFLLGMIYAAAKNVYPDDAVLSKTTYWAAVDQFIKAKQVDPSLAEGANEMIATYSKYFPTKEEIFFHKDLNGKTSFTIGSWIGETTAVREAKQ